MKNLFENNDAIFSADRKQRFVLWRIWDNFKPKIMYIGLNPSTANEINSDPTINRLKRFTFNFNYGGFYMLNLFSIITPYPKELELLSFSSKINNNYIIQYAQKSEKIVFAWGNFKEAKNRSTEVINLFNEAYCFGKNKDGSPKHPLYLKSTTKLIEFNCFEND